MSTQPQQPDSPANSAGDVLPTVRPECWTRQRQAEFLVALAATHSVAAAAREVGMSRQSAYKLRARLHGEPFDLAWSAAVHSAFDRLIEAALERAVNGVEVPQYHKGELVGTSRRYDERLTVALLSHRHGLGRIPPRSWNCASAYRSDDFAALLGRVEDGPETWAEEQDDLKAAMEALDAAEAKARARGDVSTE